MTTKVIAIAAISLLVVPVAAGGVAVATLVFGHLPGNLPKQKPAIVALPSQVFDAVGNPIGVYRQFDLTVPTQPGDMPQVLEDAVVAAEDKRFWEHKGIDVRGIARAAWVDYQAGDRVQGASTITQQYVKKTYLTDDRSWSRKLREAVLATQLERRMSKEDILFNYLNTIYFGSGAYGAGAAAVSYFGKPVSQLTLSEAATLAGLIPAPHAWSPRIDAPKTEERRRLVLDKMLEQQLITQAQYDEAVPLRLWLLTDGPPPGPATVVQPQPTKGSGVYPYFVDWVEQELVAKYGPEKVYKGGLRIETTLDPRLQALAQQAVSDQLEGTEAPLDMALVSVEPSTGLVRAMVGGRDYNASQVNLATGGILGFQPGSSFKPFVLAAAFEQGIPPETVYSAPSQFRVPGCEGDNCTLGNYDGGGGGRMNLRRATASSVNTVFAQLILDVGVARTAEMANRLGATSVRPDGAYGASLALGSAEVSPLEMAAAYGTLANQGVRLDPTPIMRVFDKDGHLLEDNTARAGTRAVSVNVAANVTDVLTDVVRSGTGTAARLDRPVAGKTGTAESYRAAWFVGYTPQLSTSVWMGYADVSRPLRGINGVGAVTGGSLPTQTWAAFMRPATAGMPVVEFPAPGKLQAEPPPEQKPGAGLGASQEPPPRAVTPDTTVKAGGQQSTLDTPADCGGPCQLYDGPLNLPVPAAATAAPAPATTPPAAPTAGQSTPSGGPTAAPATTTPPR